MKPHRTRLAGALSSVVLIVGASSSGAAQSAAPASPDDTGVVPATITYDTGTITLAPRILRKIANGEPLDFVNSYPYITIAGAAAQMQAGAELAAAEIEAKYGIRVNTRMIGVPSPDAPTQISQIAAGLDSDEYDCLGIHPNPPGAFTDQISEVIAAGIPVFTVNGDTEGSERIAVSMADDNVDMESPLQMGRIAGSYAIGWAMENSQTFDGKKVALITGDAAAPWAQGRLQGFVDTIRAEYPSVEFIGSPTDAYMVGFESETALSRLQSFHQGHPDTFFYFSSDWGGIQIGRLIEGGDLKGKVFGLGFNIDAVYVELLQDEYLIGTIDQRYDLQAKNWALMCAQVLFERTAPPQFNWVTPNIWNADNIDEALALYSGIPNSGVTE